MIWRAGYTFPLKCFYVVFMYVCIDYGESITSPIRYSSDFRVLYLNIVTGHYRFHFKSPRIIEALPYLKNFPKSFINLTAFSIRDKWSLLIFRFCPPFVKIYIFSITTWWLIVINQQCVVSRLEISGLKSGYRVNKRRNLSS